ncbi:hypothetical protein S7711_02981 [Stachybotrys chartarum IBT 7711]|uniref:Uncharacterized protein n=1 Tax=Stachybotrys chartarum (strain CBS 109288 / IBT 7711) TaxID=1280523 RepID=A0A084B2H8_STACB|nr:hypothetical protein S7711_02981 [Stachybotrys chartarum IBT 7711]
MPLVIPGRPDAIASRPSKKRSATKQVTPVGKMSPPSKVVKRKSKATVKNSSVEGNGVFIGSTDDNRQNTNKTTIHDRSSNRIYFLPNPLGVDKGLQSPHSGKGRFPVFACLFFIVIKESASPTVADALILEAIKAIAQIKSYRGSATPRSGHQADSSGRERSDFPRTSGASPGGGSFCHSDDTMEDAAPDTPPGEDMEIDAPDPNRHHLEREATNVIEQLKQIGGRIDSLTKSLKTAQSNYTKTAKPLFTAYVHNVQRRLRKLMGLITTPVEADFELLYPSTFESPSVLGDLVQESKLKLSRLRDHLQPALQHSASLQTHGQKINFLMASRGNRGFSRNPDQEEISFEFAKCLATIDALERSLGSFQGLFNNLFGHYEQHADVETARARVKFQASREASALLCRQLSTICDLHDCHHVYFNLEVEHQGDKEGEEREGYSNNVADKDIIFHIAVKRMDEHKDRLVWLKANFNSGKPATAQPYPSPIPDSSTWSSSYSRQEKTGGRHPLLANLPTPTSPPASISDRCRECIVDAATGAMFCIGKLPIDMDFEFRVSICALHQRVCSLHHPDPHIKDKQLTYQPTMLLSEWITQDYRDQQSRIRLAKLIAESVLTFDPAIWRRTKLRTDKLMIIAPERKYDCTIESHIGVPLVYQSKRGSSSNTDAASEEKVTLGEVLLNLGITLLELGDSKIMPRPDLERGRVNPDSIQGSEIQRRMQADSLKKQMGGRYTEVVQYCIKNRHRDEDMYDLEPQTDLYKNVVQVLEQEEVGGQAYAKLSKVAFSSTPGF